jgi:hypothetical protein
VSVESCEPSVPLARPGQFLFMQANGSELRELGALYDSGKLRPVIDSTFPFDQTREAMAYAGPLWHGRHRPIPGCGLAAGTGSAVSCRRPCSTGRADTIGTVVLGRREGRRGRG